MANSKISVLTSATTPLDGVTSGSSNGSLNYAAAGSTNQYVETDATNSSICIGQIVYFV
jgi:hypothetical protein